jgi:hypothetical protein
MSDGLLAALAEAGHDQEATAARASAPPTTPLAVQCAKRLIHG